MVKQMIVLSSKDVHKSYGIDVILEKITFNINEGEKIGLIGENGAGKTTLFKILTGELSQDYGDYYIDKNKKVGYLSQHLSLNNENNIYNELMTVFQDLTDLEDKINELQIKLDEPYDILKEDYNNKIIKEFSNCTDLYEHRGGYTYKGQISRVLKGLGFIDDDFGKAINILSGGQKTRVALCKLLLTNPEVLLLDEPTNHLDLDAIEWLEGYLKEYKGTIVIISHDRFFLDSITSRTFEMINGHINCYNGNYSAFIDLKKKEFEVQLKAYTMQQDEIKRQEDIIEKYRSFNREKSVRAADSRQKSLDKVERIDAPDKEQAPAKIKFETMIKSGNDVLHIEDLSKSYDDRLLFDNLFLNIRKTEKIALIGQNGRGKTTLFRIIMDTVKPDTGIHHLGQNVFLGYYDQEQSNLNEEKTVIDEVWDEFPHMTTTQVRSALAAFLFRGDDIFKIISLLSGGEKCRINLLKLMLSKSNFLLLDEPTNHLDIMSREALEDALLGYDGTAFIISHDRYFLNKVVDKIYELKEDGLKEYLGNYSYYLEKKKNPLRFEEENLNTGKTKTQIQEERKKKRDIERQEKDKQLSIKNLEESIGDLESKLEEFQKLLCLEEIYSNSGKTESVNLDIKKTEFLLQGLYDEWENQ